MQVGLGSPLHGRHWLLQHWLCRLQPWGGCVHGGDEQQHHKQLSSEEQVDLGHGEKGSGVSEHSLSPSAPFWINSPAKEQRPQASLAVCAPGRDRTGSELALVGGLIPLCLADSGDIVKIAAYLQFVQHPSRLSRHTG